MPNAATIILLLQEYCHNQRDLKVMTGKVLMKYSTAKRIKFRDTRKIKQIIIGTLGCFAGTL